MTKSVSNIQSTSALPGFTGFYRVLLGFTGFYWVLLGFTGLCQVLLGFTGFYWVLMDFTGFYGVLPSFTGLCQVLLGFTGFFQVLQGFTRFYLVLLFFFLGLLGFYWVGHGWRSKFRFPEDGKIDAWRSFTEFFSFLFFTGFHWTAHGWRSGEIGSSTNEFSITSIKTNVEVQKSAAQRNGKKNKQ